jgi:hypothetical protein
MTIRTLNTLVCNGCGVEFNEEPSEHLGRTLREQAAEDGWRLTKSTVDQCPACIPERKPRTPSVSKPPKKPGPTPKPITLDDFGKAYHALLDATDAELAELAAGKLRSKEGKKVKAARSILDARKRTK